MGSFIINVGLEWSLVYAVKKIINKIINSVQGSSMRGYGNILQELTNSFVNTLILSN